MTFNCQDNPTLPGLCNTVIYICYDDQLYTYLFIVCFEMVYICVNTCTLYMFMFCVKMHFTMFVKT